MTRNNTFLKFSSNLNKANKTQKLNLRISIYKLIENKKVKNINLKIFIQKLKNAYKI